MQDTRIRESTTMGVDSCKRVEVARIASKIMPVALILFLKFDSIPLEYKDGRSKLAMCSMYSRNYSQIANVLNAENSTAVFKDPFDNITSCVYGWKYDTSVFESTVVTEVILTVSAYNIDQNFDSFLPFVVESGL